jgi:hypothetical protein
VPGHQSRILSTRLNTVPKTENTEYGNLSGWTNSSDDQGVGLRAAADPHDRPSLRGHPRKLPRNKKRAIPAESGERRRRPRCKSSPSSLTKMNVGGWERTFDWCLAGVEFDRQAIDFILCLMVSNYRYQHEYQHCVSRICTQQGDFAENERAGKCSPAIQIHNLVRFPAIAYAGRAAIRGMSDMERPLLADTVEKVLFGV